MGNSAPPPAPAPVRAPVRAPAPPPAPAPARPPTPSPSPAPSPAPTPPTPTPTPTSTSTSTPAPAPARALNAIIRNHGDLEVRDNKTLTLRFGDNSMNVSIHKVSDVALAYTSNQDDTMRHYGVVVMNEFRVGEQTFNFLLFHALKSGSKGLKVDLFFASSFEDVKSRLSGLLRNPRPVLVTDFQKASAHATAPVIAEAIHGYLKSDFEYAVKEMALQSYGGLANCFLVATHFRAICVGKSSPEAEEEVEASVQMMRGSLLSKSHVDIDTIEGGIPCTDAFFWSTVREKRTDRGLFRLQQHKFPILKTPRSVVSWSIHGFDYRIIFQPVDARDWSYSWRDIARGDSLDELQERFKVLSKHS